MHHDRLVFSLCKYCKGGFTKHNNEMHASKSDAFFVTTLQGWAYKKQARCIMIVWCFLCDNIARMGLQTHRCMREIRRFLCNKLQGWAYKTQRRDACEQSATFFVTQQRDACGQSDALFVTDGFTKHNKHARCMMIV